MVLRTGEDKPVVVGSNRMLTTAQAAEYLAVARKTLQVNYAKWKIPYYRVGQRINFRQSDLDRWLKTRRIEP
jgi:excisionase family DNA binding protein